MQDKSFPSHKPVLTSYQKAALALCLLLFLITLGSVFWITAKSSDNSSSSSFYADIYQNGELKQSIALASVTEPFTFRIYGEQGQTNTIEIRPEGIGIISASCPDKLCVNQGFISNSQLPITCLPNRLVIQIRQDDGNNITPDIITY